MARASAGVQVLRQDAGDGAGQDADAGHRDDMRVRPRAGTASRRDVRALALFFLE
jgi:hypothetical protein